MIEKFVCHYYRYFSLTMSRISRLKPKEINFFLIEARSNQSSAAALKQTSRATMMNDFWLVSRSISECLGGKLMLNKLLYFKFFLVSFLSQVSVNARLLFLLSFFLINFVNNICFISIILIPLIKKTY